MKHKSTINFLVNFILLPSNFKTSKHKLRKTKKNMFVYNYIKMVSYF